MACVCAWSSFIIVCLSVGASVAPPSASELDKVRSVRCTGVLHGISSTVDLSYSGSLSLSLPSERSPTLSLCEGAGWVRIIRATCTPMRIRVCGTSRSFRQSMRSHLQHSDSLLKLLILNYESLLYVLHPVVHQASLTFHHLFVLFASFLICFQFHQLGTQ